MDKSYIKGTWLGFCSYNFIYILDIYKGEEVEAGRMSTRARSLEVNELSGVPETQQSQQAAGVEELVVGVEDPLEMSDIEQGDFGLETQHDLDSSNEDTQDTQAAGGTQKGKGKGKGKGKADKRSKKPAVLYSAEQEQKLVDFLVIMKFPTTSV